jgi:hypothetical protein
MSEFLLVEVAGGAQQSNALEAELYSRGDVLSVTVHGEGCCCSNCPWKGSHER